jgi:hypothetical protein
MSKVVAIIISIVTLVIALIFVQRYTEMRIDCDKYIDTPIATIPKECLDRWERER